MRAPANPRLRFEALTLGAGPSRSISRLGRRFPSPLDRESQRARTGLGA